MKTGNVKYYQIIIVLPIVSVDKNLLLYSPQCALIVTVNLM